MPPSSKLPHQFLLECFGDPSPSSTSIEYTWVLETLTSTNGELDASLLKDLFEAVPDLFYKSSESAKERLGLKLLEDWINVKNPCPPLPSSVPDFLFVNSDYECGVDIDKSSLYVLLTLLRKAKMTSRADQIEGGVEYLRHYIHQFINKKRKTLPNSIANLESFCKEARELIPFSTDKISVLGIKQIPVAQKCLYTIDGNVESKVDASESVASENGNVSSLEYDAMHTEQQAAPNCKENELLKQIATTFIADTSILISQGPSGSDNISPLEVLSDTVIGEQIFEETSSITNSKNDEMHEGATFTVNNNDILHKGTIVGENSKEIMEQGHLSTENATLTAREDDSLHECSPYTENDEDDWEGDSDSENDYLISHEGSVTPKFNFLKRITSSIRGLFGIHSRASIPSSNENNNEMSPVIEDGIDVMQEDPFVRNSSDENMRVGPQIDECENENENLLECHPVIVGSKLSQPPADTEDDNKIVQDSFFTATDGDTQTCNQLLQDSPPVIHKTNESQNCLGIEMDIKSVEEVPCTYPECSKQIVNNADTSQDNTSPRIFVQNNEMLMNEKLESIHVLPEQERESGDRRTVDLCFKCHRDGSLLSCRDANCCVVFHEKCVSLLDPDEQGRSHCPLCFYKQAMLVYHTTKVRYSQAKKSFKHFLGKDATNHMKRKRRQAKDENIDDSDKTRKCRRTAIVKEEVKEENVVSE